MSEQTIPLTLDSSVQEGKEDSTNSNKEKFSSDLVRKYPKSNKKIGLEVSPYALRQEGSRQEKNQSLFISPYGVEFQSQGEYSEGQLLKIEVSLPDYWSRKQKFVEYARIDSPKTFFILGKVIHTEEIGKRGRKKNVLVQTVNMDEIDEQVLKSFLQDN